MDESIGSFSPVQGVLQLLLRKQEAIQEFLSKSTCKSFVYMYENSIVYFKSKHLPWEPHAIFSITYTQLLPFMRFASFVLSYLGLTSKIYCGHKSQLSHQLIRVGGKKLLINPRQFLITVISLIKAPAL